MIKLEFAFGTVMTLQAEVVTTFWFVEIAVETLFDVAPLVFAVLKIPYVLPITTAVVFADNTLP